MNNGIYVICAVLLLSAVTLGGCGAQSQERMDHVVIEETPDGGMRISDESSYEYEIQELSAWRDENQIYGVAYIPQMETEQMPAVIYAHGYGATHQNGIQYAEKLTERRFVVYCFDFCGGSTSSQSDGSTLEMSVFTEQADLEIVIEMVGELEYVDSSHVFLLWASQGGGSGITVPANKEKLNGLILLYPAFELVETVQALFSSPEEIPESSHLQSVRWLNNKDMLSFSELEIYPCRQKVYCSGKEINLRAKEFDFLCLFVVNRRHVQSLRRKLYQEYPDAPFAIRCFRNI